MGLNRESTARDMGYQGIVHTIQKQVTFATEGSAVDFDDKLPEGASVVGGGIHVITAFDDSATVDVGFRDGSTTDDADAYAGALDVTGVGFIALDNLAATSNIRQTKAAIPTVTVNDGTGAVSAGMGWVIINYVLPVT